MELCQALGAKMVPATAGYMVYAAGGQALGLPESSPVAFSSGSNFGDIWPTPGEVAVEGEACELSPQRTVMKTRHPEANAESAPWGEMRSQAVLSHSTPGTAMQGSSTSRLGRAQVSSGAPHETCIRKDAN